jgi:hypothetical protein
MTMSYVPCRRREASFSGVRKEAISPVTATRASYPVAAFRTIPAVALPVGRRRRISAFIIRKVKK